MEQKQDHVTMCDIISLEHLLAKGCTTIVLLDAEMEYLEMDILKIKDQE